MLRRRPAGKDPDLPIIVKATRHRADESRSGFGVWRSLVAHLLWEQRVAGSNPAAPTKCPIKVRVAAQG